MKSVIGSLHGALVFDRRTRSIASAVAAVLPPNATCLDVGAGDGTIAAKIMETRPDVSISGIDVLVRAVTRIPVAEFDGWAIPHDDANFDVVMFVDVLHHTDDPSRLLKEAARVARRLVVIKDHLVVGWFARPTLRLMDWVGNAPHGVRLPYNYLDDVQWKDAFRSAGLVEIERRERLGLYLWPLSMLFERRLHFVAALRSRSGAPPA